MVTPIMPAISSAEAIAQTLTRLRAADAEAARDPVGLLAAPLPDLVARAQVDDFRAAGWFFDTPAAIDAHTMQGDASMLFSPDLAHLAIAYVHASGRVAVWLDGQPLRAPEVAGAPVVLGTRMEWIDVRWFALEIGPPHEHPLADPLSWDAMGLGSIRGLLLFDADNRTITTVLPADDQAWTFPMARLCNGHLLVFGSPEMARDGRVGWQASLDVMGSQGPG